MQFEIPGRSLLVGAFLVAGCSFSFFSGAPAPPPPSNDCPAEITGPVSGAVRRFVLDGMTLPGSSKDFAADLNGDEEPDNQLGNVMGALAASANEVAPEAVLAMLRAGRVFAVLEIQSDDEATDPTVAVRFTLGADGSGPSFTVLGALAGGAFVSNRTRCLHEAIGGQLAVPAFIDADPVAAPIVGPEIELTPDAGGLQAILRAGTQAFEYMHPIYDGFDQMMRARPWLHPFALVTADEDKNGAIDFGEFSRNPFYGEILRPDVRLFTDGKFAPNPYGESDSLSLALKLHFKTCASGTCADPSVTPSCLDRVKNGDESDVDCGGSCAGCAGGFACTKDADCDAKKCAARKCVAPTCSDGIKDAAETDVDCGNFVRGLSGASPGPWTCPTCANGKKCGANGWEDCASRHCVQGTCRPCVLDSDCTDVGSGTGWTAECVQGTCVLRCRDGVRDGMETDVDCGGGTCFRCEPGKACNAGADCLSGICTARRCD